MQTTKNYGFKKPEPNDPYNIEDFNESFELIDAELKAAADKANTSSEHPSDMNNPHQTTAAQVGLGNVPNVATNDQTPTYTVASANTAMTSGEKLSVAFGKIAKAINSLIAHLSDTVGHITAAERTKWNAKLDTAGGTVSGIVNYTNSTWGVNLTKTDFEKGDIPSENIFWAVNLMDNRGAAHTNRIGLLQTLVDTTGGTVTQVHAMRNEASSSETAVLSIHCLKDGTKYAQAPTPTSATDNSTKIATTAWVNGYALPKGGTATRATSDANGSNIASTYRKKSEGSVVAIQQNAPTDTTALWVW